MSNLISNNSDFLFIYEAALCNPNGDPDQENKPRMDYETKTNLVTDTRVKRYIRDFIIANGGKPETNNGIFVSMEGTSKVSVNTKLINIINRVLDSEAFKSIEDNNSVKKLWLELKKEVEIETKTNTGYWSELMEIFKKKKKDLTKEYQEFKSIVDDKLPQLNDELLFWITKNQYIDIRWFGSAVAVSGFPRTITGAIQLNWGYSLNKVEILDSDSIVTIMNDGSSTFGKDYRVKYSLLAFHGAVNKFAAKSTGLTTSDLEAFRRAIWQSIGAMPTRSKINQYPKAYIEIVYNDGFSNGHFGDLRNLISTKPKDGLNDEKVQKFDHLTLDVSKLKKLISEDKDKAIKEVIIQTSPDFPPINS